MLPSDGGSEISTVSRDAVTIWTKRDWRDMKGKLIRIDGVFLVD